MRLRGIRLIGLGALFAMIASGCGQKNLLLLPNQPPEVEVFAQRVDGIGAGPSAYRLQWSGHDPDGVVANYLYAVGSPADDARTGTWTATTARSHALSFPARAAAPERATLAAREPSVFSVMAVDGAGARSAPARVAFFDGLLAPSVRVTAPAANPLVRYYVTSTVCFEWEGTAFEDSTGASARIVEYKYIMLTDQTAVTLMTARSQPDSVRRYYAPRNWEGWTSVRGNVTSEVITNLVPDKEYGFVITAFDEAGNYDPIFSWNKNMVYMRVTLPGAQLPRIGAFNEFFIHEQAQGSFDPSRVVNLQVPAGQQITFNWYALPLTDSRGNVTGGPIRSYRWGLDLADVEDPRQGDPHGHSGHWTRWGTTTSATVGPFAPGETHHLYIEANNDLCEGAEEMVGLLSLRLNVVQPTFDKDLLIVDDTRYLLDRVSAGTTCEHPSNRPTGNWPTQAELDTFLYARGGVPWRCYPPVTLSTPGVFNGYRFDTLGTNLRVFDLTVPLSTLVQYRHVIWLVNGAAALNNKPGTDLGDINGPVTSLRYMTENRRENTLAAYVRQGGKVWLAGGGAATASMIAFNRVINDNSLPIPRTLTFRNTDNELVPGRFVYDQAHWQSEFKQFRVNNGRIRRYLGRLEGSPGLYAGLPAEIRLKSPSTDPFPPNRVGNQAVFYQTQADIEFLSASNEILEDQDPRPPHEDFQPTLDSLYKATASTLRPDTGPDGIQSVVMTYYRGQDNPPFVVTGFNIWNFRRSDCVALVDFVLQQLWGLTREVPVAAPVEVSGVEDAAPVGRHARPREGRASAVTNAAGARAGGD